MKKDSIIKDIDSYIALQPVDVKVKLEKLRHAIKSVAPDAEEVISYGMPAFKLNGMLVWFAANKNHIGLYPTASPMIVFKNKLTDYKTSKGAIQFPIEKAIPITLVKEIVKFKVKENLEKVKAKKKK
ncbi:MAG: iron chaperone [Bacteroidia bacterium]